MKVWIIWFYSEAKKRPDIQSIHKTKAKADAEKDRLRNDLTFIIEYKVEE